MAHSPRGYLDHRRARFSQSLCIVIRRKVADDDSRLELFPKSSNRLPQKSSLARAWRGKDIQNEKPSCAEEAPIAFGQSLVLAEYRLPHFHQSALVRFMLVLMLVSLVGMRMRVNMWMRMPMLVFLTVVKPRPMRVLMLMFVLVPVGMSVIMLIMLVGMVVRANPNRVFSRQSASAISTHYSISKEATSISRPARSSPLGVWQSGHSANISSD